MSLPSSGSITPRSTASTSSGVGRVGSGHARILPARARVNSMAVTTPRLRRLDLLKALGDNTRYAIYLELARSPVAAGHRRDRRDPRRCTPTPCGPTSSACASVGLLDVDTDAPGHRRAARSTATRSPPTRRRSASSRPPSRCWPACSSAWPPPPALSAADAVEAGREQGSRRPPSVGRGPARAPRPSSPSWPRSASTPQTVDRRPTAPRSPSPTARSASWPRATPSWCAACTGAWSRASSTSRGDARVARRSTTSADRTPCQVEIASRRPR